MASTKINDILKKAAELLQDNDFVRWPKDDLREWLHDGELAVCIQKPNAFVTNGNVQLVAGTKQSLPDTGNTFMEMTRSMGVNGMTPGRVPRFIPKKILDEQNPNWHKNAVVSEPIHYTFDNRDPKHFYVYPPQPAVNPVKAEVVYSDTPPPLATDDNATINLDAIYGPPLINYVVYRAYAKDTSYAGNTERAAMYLKMFYDLLGAKATAEVANNAATNRPGNPSSAG